MAISTIWQKGRGWVEPADLPNEPLPGSLENMLNDLLKEEKTVPDPSPTKNKGLKYTFDIYKAANGYVVSCGGKYWVCPDDRDVLEVVKLAIADTRL